MFMMTSKIHVSTALLNRLTSTGKDLSLIVPVTTLFQSRLHRQRGKLSEFVMTILCIFGIIITSV